MAKKTSLKPKQKAAKSKGSPRLSGGGGGKSSSVDRALKQYEMHDAKIEHHRNKRDIAEARIKIAGHEIQHVYPGESPRSMGKPKIKVVKVGP